MREEIASDTLKVIDLPMTFNPARMQHGEPGLMCERDRPSRFGILPRHGDNRAGGDAR